MKQLNENLSSYYGRQNWGEYFDTCNQLSIELDRLLDRRPKVFINILYNNLYWTVNLNNNNNY